MPSPRQLVARYVLPRWRDFSIRWRRADGAMHLLVDDPPILHVLYWTNRKDPLAFIGPMQEVLRDHPLHIICSFSWDMDPPKAIDAVERVYSRRRKRFERHQIHYLACTPRQREQLIERGISAVLCSNTALVDEALYHPIPGVVKRYDAIYDARLSPFKRHQLAEKVGKLALLTGPVSDPGDAPYAEEIRRRLAHAHWCNSPFEARYRSLEPDEVNRHLNEARVGLCLSAIEGGMYASMQYLLAGLPVVSTPSAGGRDQFYDPDYTAIVEPVSAAVAEGVRRMADCPVPPEEIRSRTLGRLREHRANLFDLVDRICREEGRPRQFANDWPRVLVDKLARYRLPFGPIVRRIRAADRGATGAQSET